MSGRHRSYAASQNPSPRRPNSQRGSGFPTGLVATGAVVVLAAGGGYAYYAKHNGDSANAATGTPAGCTGPATTLTIAASPDLYTPLNQYAIQHGGCVHITVNSAEAAAVAGYLAGTAKGGSDITAAPDVWIPDTSMWIDVARGTDQGKQAVPAAGPSIATSPIVVGMPKPLADAAGYPAKPFGWQDLLTNVKSNKFQLAVPDPDTSGPGLAAVTVIRGLLLAQAGTDQTKLADANRTMTGLFRLLANNAPANLSTLLTNLPTNQATSPTSGGIAAFPATEQKILAYNSANPAPAVPLVGVYPAEGTTALDYPYVESSHLDAAHKAAAEDFLKALQSTGFTDALTKAGFRDAKLAAGAPITPALGLNPAVPRLLPADTTHTAGPATLKVWSTISEQTRGLIVLDVSGSMGLPVPGQFAADGKTPLTRLQITAAACMGGLPLFGDSSELGVWTFTTKSKAEGGGTVHNELIPMGPLNGDVDGTPRRSAITTALTGVSVQPGARNGLYDTILDAYQNVLNGWAENKVNAVVVFTDGKDDGLNSMSADQLIAKINGLKAANPTHKVRVLVVALGKGVDLTTLSKITATADGKALYADTPQKIGQVVMDGFTSRLDG